MAKVVLLLSDKRSGSTMLQEELCKHSAIAHVDYSPHTYFETHHWVKAAVILQRPDELFSSGRRYGSRANAREYMVDTLVRNIPGYEPPADDERLVFEGWEALCRHFARPVFFEKSPQTLAEWAALSLLLDWIGRTDMEVRVIGLVRNPLAVQYSARELFATRAETRQYGWLAIQRNLLAFQSMLPAGTMRTVRYEDIIADPVEQLGALSDFIGVEREPAVGRSVHAQSREKWRSDENYTLQLDGAVRQIARHLGYPESELANPNEPTPEKLAAMRPGLKQQVRTWLSRWNHRLVRPGYLRLKAAMSTGRS
jgi:hypothetical protein